MYVKKHPQSIKKVCDRCFFEFEDTTNHKRQRFCSTECLDKNNNLSNVERSKTCLRCSSVFVDRAYANNSMFCTKKCKREFIPNRIKHSLRSRLNHAVKRNFKSGSAVKDLGCSVVELKNHLESKFQLGMTWENYGHKTWHIDHIKPLVLFDLCDPCQLKKACHYTNLQPLWAKDNLVKSNKYKGK